MKQLIKLSITSIIAIALLSCNGGNQQQAVQPQVVDQPAVAATTPDTTQPAAQPQAAPASAAQAQALPEPINAFLKQYFPNATVAYVENDHDHGSLAYELTLNDGTEVDFYADNQWDKVDCHTKAVPAALVPNAVAAYVNANYKGMTITKIDKEHGGFEVELNNGIDLNFSASGQFLGVDD